MSQSEIEQWERSVGRDVVRAHRLRRGWSQQQLADAMVDQGFTSVMQTTIAKIEAGTRPLRLGEFVAIAHAFGMPWSSLMADAEPMLDPKDPLTDMEAAVRNAKREEDRTREAMDASVRKAVNDYADAVARTRAFSSEFRRLSEGNGDAPATHPAK